MARSSLCPQLLIGILSACGLHSTIGGAVDHPHAVQYGNAGSVAALAMEGGGFRALTSDAGLISGLLAALGQRSQAKNLTLASSGLLDRFSTISTNSGSSWFMSELIYSASFLQLLDSMASSPGTVSALFRAGWTDPWLKKTGVTSKSFNLRVLATREIVKKLLGSADEDMIYLLTFFLANGATWEDFVSVLLDSTGSITSNTSLSAPIGAWAKEKIWIVDHAILLPSTTKKARLFQGKLLYPQASYVISEKSGNAPDVPLFVPATFSMTLGAGPNASAPFPYVASTAIASLERLDYTGDVPPFQFKASSASLGADLAGGSLIHNVGMLPIARVAAASSACFGSFPAMGFLVDEGAVLLDADVTPWVSSAPDGRAFDVAKDVVFGLKEDDGVTKQALDQLASLAVHGLVDGGFTDGTGISQAVAAGASEVLVVLNSNATNDPFYIEMLFKDGPSSEKPGVPSELYPVFETLASEVTKAFGNFHRLTIPQGAEYLKVFTVGTIQAVTADNRFFGTKGGRPITINVVNIGSVLSIGAFENFLHYDALAQDIVSTLTGTENAPFVHNTLLPLFLGAGTSASSEARLFV